MKQVNEDVLSPKFEYDTNAERQVHLNQMLTNGWKLTHAGGGGQSKEVLFAQFEKMF